MFRHQCHARCVCLGCGSVLRTQGRLVLRKKAEKRLPEQRGLLYDADKKIKKTILYKELRDSYIENQDEKLEYYITERSIRDKIKMMKEFISECNYKYLFFA